MSFVTFSAAQLLALCVASAAASGPDVQGSDDFLLARLYRLKEAYPEYIKDVDADQVTWFDDFKMPVGRASGDIDSPTLYDQLQQVYPVGENYLESLGPGFDPGRARYTNFFHKMYGMTRDDVERHLVSVPWLPKSFGNKSKVLVTTVNSVDKKVAAISAELDALPMELRRYLRAPGGTFCWRVIAGTTRQSAHSFGMTIDINVKRSHYWRWDLRAAGHLEEEIDERIQLGYQNEIPWPIVDIFERHGFIWGGKWYHYDTMHFEYRPELF